MQLTKDFSTDEMKCPCCGVCDVTPPLMAKLQTLRTKWGKPIRVTSGYRCEKHNLAVGGVSDSQHTVGKAADIEVDAASRYDFINLALSTGFTGIGIANNFVHLDVQEGPPALWKYNR